MVSPSTVATTAEASPTNSRASTRVSVIPKAVAFSGTVVSMV